jgi:hypothetical protein
MQIKQNGQCVPVGPRSTSDQEAVEGRRVVQIPQTTFRHSGAELTVSRCSNPSNQPLPLPCAPQVKQIMEEAVTRKFVHEDSSHIISFCGEW